MGAVGSILVWLAMTASGLAATAERLKGEPAPEGGSDAPGTAR